MVFRNSTHITKLSQLLNFLLFKPLRIPVLFFALIVCALAMYWGFSTTHPLPCGGPGDCVKYTAMSEAFQSNTAPSIEYPFNIRILSPWLASHLSDSAANGFSSLTFVSFLAFVVAWYFVAKELKFETHAFIFLTVWFLVHPLGIHYYYSVRELVDPLAYALIATTVYFYIKRKNTLFFVTTLIALFEKESFFFILGIAVAAESYCHYLGHTSRRNYVKFLVAALITALTYKLIIGFAQQFLFASPNHGDIFKTVRYWWRAARHDPNRFLVWIGAFFCVTGTLLALLPKKWPTSSKEEIRRSTFLTLGAVGFFVLGLTGGADMSRIMFNGIIFTYSAIFYIARESLNKPLILLVYAASLFISKTYTSYFPSTFEYGYYEAKNIIQVAVFVICALIALIALRKAFKENLNNSN